MGSGWLTWQHEGAPSVIRIALEQVSHQYRRQVSLGAIAYPGSETRIDKSSCETLSLIKKTLWRCVFKPHELLVLKGHTLMLYFQQVIGPHQQALGKGLLSHYKQDCCCLMLFSL